VKSQGFCVVDEQFTSLRGDNFRCCDMIFQHWIYSSLPQSLPHWSEFESLYKPDLPWVDTFPSVRTVMLFELFIFTKLQRFMTE